MVTAALIILCIYLLVWVLMVLTLPFLPFFTITECANSSLSKNKKTLWIIGLLLFWPLSSILFGFLISKKNFTRQFSFVFVLMLVPGLILGIANWKYLSIFISGLKNQNELAQSGGGDSPKNTQDKLAQSLALLECSTVALSPGKLDEDIEKLSTAIKAVPDDFAAARCYLLRAEKFGETGNASAAKQDHDQVRKLAEGQLAQSPGDGDAMLILSELSEALNQVPEAIKYLEQAINSDPKKFSLQKFRLEQLKSKSGS